MDASRRKFLIGLGFGSAALAGWLVANRAPNRRIPSSKPRSGGLHHPTLAPGVAPRSTSTGKLLVRRVGNRESLIVGEINEPAWEVLSRMDGLHSVEELAHAIVPGSNPGDRERCSTAVAMFLSELAQAGLLSEPFYADVYRVGHSS